MREYIKKNGKPKKNKNVEEALQILVEKEMTRLPDENEIKNMIRFPEKLEHCTKRISNIVHLIKIGRAVACIFCMLLLSATTVYGVWHTKLVQKIFDRNTDVYIEEQEELDVIQKKYFPQYLPRRYTLKERIGEVNGTDFFLSVYDNGSNQITVRQQVQNTLLNMDNEDTEQIEIEINGSHAIFVSKNDERMLIWADQSYFFVIDTDDPGLSMEELKKIALSFEEE